MNLKKGLAAVTVLAIIAAIYHWDDRDEWIRKLTNQPEKVIIQGQEEKSEIVIPPDLVISNGIPAELFYEIFGEPKGSIAVGGKETLHYDDFRVTLTNNTIVDLPENINEMFAEKTKPTTFDKLKEATRQISAPQELRAALAKRKAFTLYNSKNEPVDHTSLVSIGKVTVVHFHAPDLDDSVKVNNALELMLAEEEMVELKKIEIDSWNAEAAKAYHINTVPDIRVLDQHGFLISQPVTRIEVVDDKIDLSRVKEAIDVALKR